MSVNRKGLLKFSFIALLFLGLIVAWLGFGERGFIQLYRLEQERQAHAERISKLEEENQRLLEEINRLRNDRKYIESVARRELGLIKEDETLYRFMRKKENDRSTETGKGKTQP